MSPSTLKVQYPPLYKPTDAARLYTPRIQEFAAAGLKAGMTPAHTDKKINNFVGIDLQFDFCHPDGALYVNGAEQDLEKLLEWLYANAHKITNLYLSLDTHHFWQIFFANWWAYEDGTNPDIYTIISLNDKNEAVDQNGRLIRPLVDPKKSLKYLADLKAGGKFSLMIWPYHTMKGMIGQALMPALAEFVAYWAAARKAQPILITKGESPFTENYGIFGAEVPDPADPSTGMNTVIMDAIARGHDTYITGQAKSHCVLTSGQQYVGKFENDPQILARTSFLMFATSSVYHPAIDFEAIANAAFAELEKKGVQLINAPFLL